MLQPAIEVLGLELWGVEYLTKGRSALLRVYIDSEEGVTIDDCEKVSRQISAILDVEDPIAGEYTLEVSSPGLDRPLFAAEHYTAYVGEVINVRLSSPIDGRRKFKGVLNSADPQKIVMTVDNQPVEILFSQIEKANVAY
ncbi:ribosome maturation factor RimP [Pseudohongiella nitratireducens]|jgi:ribosome maturation factor RimP|uniref:Ribosome maturation factor RimP n=2 Tax=Pseudohongiella nitratireducens TaxID=1768907 RepID=A0A916QL30_9GAMM|nr:ribosome maturation factor RimP [Pseudohongiella nitratireducens]|tara:strand:+ start:3966 stop:4385 length:420 start_codon:yes stop_codon:yes gene_type:complete